MDEISTYEDYRPAREQGMIDIDEIVDNFEFLDDWDQRYQYLVELGENLEPLADALKTVENWVKPCMSTVHVAAEAVPRSPGLIRFRGDCDTAVIKGVLALLIDLMSYRNLADIHELDVDSLFTRLRLEENLSPNRHVGIYAIVDKMLERAEALTGADTRPIPAPH
jgi:cysteine desulfuration protein SufE